MSDEADKILEKIRAKRNGGFKTYKVRITIPFTTTVLVSAKSKERALRQIQWDLMPDDREQIINTAEWNHMFGKQFDDCSISETDQYDLDQFVALEDLKPMPPDFTDQERHEIMERLKEVDGDSQ